MEQINVIELKYDPIYKIPEVYHAEISENGRTLMLWKDLWKPKAGEVYYEPMMVQYKPVKKVCKPYDKFENIRVYKTMKECKEFCKQKNLRLKRLYNGLKEYER